MMFNASKFIQRPHNFNGRHPQALTFIHSKSPIDFINIGIQPEQFTLIHSKSPNEPHPHSVSTRNNGSTPLATL
jgi:hypothetical protein